MKKGVEQGISIPDFAEIIANSRQIANHLDPKSPSVKEAREIREQADQRLAKSGIIVIL